MTRDLEQGVINFPHAILAGDVEELFRQLYEDSQVATRYSETTSVVIGQETRRGVNYDRDIREIRGTASEPLPSMTMVAFNMRAHLTEAATRFSGIVFDQRPESEGLKPEELELVEKVRRTVRDYFKSIRVQKKPEDEEEGMGINYD